MKTAFAQNLDQLPLPDRRAAVAQTRAAPKFRSGFPAMLLQVSDAELTRVQRERDQFDRERVIDQYELQ